MTITIIDNDAALLRSLELVLSSRGHIVTTFDEPAAACTEIEAEGCPDVLVVDYAMPGLTGRDVLTRLRERIASSCTVILISGHTDLVAPLPLDALGVTAFLPKPLDIDALTALITETSCE